MGCTYIWATIINYIICIYIYIYLFVYVCVCVVNVYLSWFVIQQSLSDLVKPKICTQGKVKVERHLFRKTLWCIRRHGGGKGDVLSFPFPPNLIYILQLTLHYGHSHTFLHGWPLCLDQWSISHIPTRLAPVPGSMATLIHSYKAGPCAWINGHSHTFLQGWLAPVPGSMATLTHSYKAVPGSMANLGCLLICITCCGSAIVQRYAYTMDEWMNE